MAVALRALWSPLAILAVAVAVIPGLAARPDAGGTTPVAPHVVIAGVVDLRWDDVDPEQTPHLWRLAETGAIGSLSARSAHRPTCAADGWLTLGAGNLAAGTLAPATGSCPPLRVTIETADRPGAFLPRYEPLMQYIQWELPWGTVPGALAGAVGCTHAVGPGAAVAAAHPSGRVDRYTPAVPERPEAAANLWDGECELTIVDLGTISGEDEQERATAATAADDRLGRIVEARPPDSFVLVVGVADSEPGPHLQVAVGAAPNLGPGWLTSATTGRIGYLQLVDAVPTTLAATGRPDPAVPLAGNPAYVTPGRPADLGEAVADLVAAEHQAGLARPVSAWFLAGLTAAQLALFGAVVPLLRRPERLPRWWRALAPVLLVAAALAIPAALTAGGLPWWRAQAAGGVFALASLAVLAAASVLVVRTPPSRRTLGLVGASAALAAAAVALDLLTGSWLQLGGVVGYAALDSGRYAGLSEIGLGVLVAGTLLLAGCLAEQVRRRWRPLVMAAVGAVGVVLAGSPYLGDEIGGAIALGAGVCVAAAACTGGWLTATRAGWASLLGVVVLAVVAVFDLRRPVEVRTGLGGMLAQLAEGTGGTGLQRVSLANLAAFTATPLTLLVIGAGAFLWLALMRHWGGLRRLFGIHPALRAATVGAVVAALAGGLLVGAALTVAGAAAAVGVPLLTLAALRLRERSAARAGPRVAPAAAERLLE